MKRLGETGGQLEDMGQYFMTTTMATVTLPRATAIFLVSRRSTRPPRHLHQISFYALINILRKNLIGCYSELRNVRAARLPFQPRHLFVLSTADHQHLPK